MKLYENYSFYTGAEGSHAAHLAKHGRKLHTLGCGCWFYISENMAVNKICYTDCWLFITESSDTNWFTPGVGCWRQGTVIRALVWLTTL